MLHEGVYFNHAWHHGISIAHSEEDLDAVLNAAKTAVRTIGSTKEDARDET
jgi:glutamate-1-semialdehyde aminotransferase